MTNLKFYMRLNAEVILKTIDLTPLDIGLAVINSASSLLNVNGRIFACCDDQYSLYELINNQKWIKHQWADAPLLPSELTARKKLKPDFEALLGPMATPDNKKIILFPSGSKSNRTLALEFELESNSFSPLDMSSFFKNLGNQVTPVNVEGAEIFNGNYIFLNRGILSDLSSLIMVNPKSFQIQQISKIDFGSLDGVNLHGSELCLFEDVLYILSVAEASPNSYDDGAIIGSALHKISLDTFQIIDQWKFNRSVKLEGLCRWQDRWLVATDPDGNGWSEFFSFSL
jgi:hypothetical protein